MWATDPCTNVSEVQADRVLLWNGSGYQDIMEAGLPPSISVAPDRALVSDASGTGIEASGCDVTRLGYVSTLVSNAQEQLFSKEPAFSVSEQLEKTVDGGGEPLLKLNSTVTSTELNRLAGVTSGVQGQLNTLQMVAGMGEGIDRALYTGPDRLVVRLPDDTAAVEVLGSGWEGMEGAVRAEQPGRHRAALGT